MSKRSLFRKAIGFFFMVIPFTSTAQFQINAQLRTRAEFRDGQGAPLPKEANAAGFISQRTRLNVLFSSARTKTYLSLQDVRVWGQDVSTINRTTVQELNGMLLHEAWADLLLSDTAAKLQRLNIKIGRQELVYDDQRLIGNLDWLQQGRRHDAALLKFENTNWKIHLAAAFNQNKENQSGTVYNNIPPGNYTAGTNGSQMYKSMQFFYAARKFNRASLSYLFFADQFGMYNMQTVNNALTKQFVPGTWNRFTTGFYYSAEKSAYSMNASSYYQFGKNYAGDVTNAYLLSFYAARTSNKWVTGIGVDFTSKNFDPLYGTPHKFWGAMDYFYAGNGFGKGGLVDYYARIKLKTSQKMVLTADAHHFTSASSIINESSRNFGEEIDLIAAYQVTPELSMEAGVAHFFPTTLLTSPTVKNVANTKQGANWAYIMINIKPQFIFK